MPPDGADTLALWREVGQWWSGEPQLEIRRFIDKKGIRRQEEKRLPPLAPRLVREHRALRPVQVLLVDEPCRQRQPGVQEDLEVQHRALLVGTEPDRRTVDVRHLRVGGGANAVPSPPRANSDCRCVLRFESHIEEVA